MGAPFKITTKKLEVLLTVACRLSPVAYLLATTKPPNILSPLASIESGIKLNA